jgi:hypothetical protein
VHINSLKTVFSCPGKTILRFYFTCEKKLPFAIWLPESWATSGIKLDVGFNKRKHYPNKSCVQALFSHGLTESTLQEINDLGVGIVLSSQTRIPRFREVK